MRLLVIADEEPWLPLGALIEQHAPDVILTLGDLVPDVLDPLGRYPVPVLGVYGNHDDGRYLEASNTTNLHLSSATIAGVTFAGFEGCVRYARGALLQYTQSQASRLARRIPRADILVTHSPPRGVHEEPDDRAHEGFDGLLDYVNAIQPRLHLHGHTPAPPRRAVNLGETTIVHVVGHRVIDL